MRPTAIFIQAGVPFGARINSGVGRQGKLSGHEREVMRLNKNSIIPWGCVFKVTFPNDKIYVGSDTALNARLDFFKYFGSPRKGRVEMMSDMQDYLSGSRQYSLKKEILFSKENVSVGEILKVERQFIRSLDSKNPKVGYNR